MAINLQILLCTALWCLAMANPLPKPRPFKCAGDTERVCETGFCYDALGFYEGGKNVGCAPPEMCQSNGCFMYNKVFTCCCNNRFCNGKTQSLMMSKYRRFQDNDNVWPTFFPRLHVRNVTTVPQQHEEGRDVRLSPLKTTTSFPDKPTTFGTTVKKIEYIQPSTLPEYTTRTTQKQAEVATTTLKSTTPKKVEISSTTTKATTAPTTTTTSASPKKVEVTTKPQPKIVAPVEEEDKDFDDDEFDLRTTRSNNNRDRPTTAPTTTRKATTKARRPGSSTAHPTFIPATLAPEIPPKQREAHVQKAFPWYYVTIIGFIIACILFGIAVFFIRRFRARKAERRHSADSAPNSSLDSSRVSDLGNLQANEHAREPVDPLLRKS